MTRFIALLCATMNLYRGKYIDRGSDFSREILYREKNKFKYRGRYIYQSANNFDLEFGQLWNNRQRLNLYEFNYYGNNYYYSFIRLFSCNSIPRRRNLIGILFKEINNYSTIQIFPQTRKTLINWINHVTNNLTIDIDSIYEKMYMFSKNRNLIPPFV